MRQLAESISINLILGEARKGYSRALRDGMKTLEASYLLCLDSDGECDAKDFERFWKIRAGSDVVPGRRVNRADTVFPKTASWMFFRIYQMFYGAPVHDPSCPYVLVKKAVVQDLVDELGAMQQGFWWEFVARAHRHGYSIQELAVNHRLRAAGSTQVYKLSKLPGIGWRHLSRYSSSSTKQRRQPETPRGPCGRNLERVA